MVGLLRLLVPGIPFRYLPDPLTDIPQSFVVALIVNDQSVPPAPHRQQPSGSQIGLAAPGQGDNGMVGRILRSPTFEYLVLDLVPRLVRDALDPERPLKSVKRLKLRTIRLRHSEEAA